MVVIAILAAITVVAYNGIQNRSRDAVVKSEVSVARKQIGVFAAANNDSFPTTINSCPTPVTGAACVLKDSKNTLAYAGTPSTFCFSATDASGIAYYVTESGIVTSGGCNPRSCYQIQQAGNSTGDGVYSIQPGGSGSLVPAYCDMTIAGGGWTLLVSNPGPATSWNGTNVYSLNTSSPSPSSLYSNLNQANGIKSNIGGTVNYMMDAVTRGRWGGVWSAPYSVDLQSTAPQDKATLIQQFDTWAQDTNSADGNGTQTPSNVIPWVSSIGSSPGLTTWGNTGNWYGTLVTYSVWNPAPWINTGQVNPGAIWYWVR